MKIQFSSKTVEMTDKLREFLELKLSRLRKFSSVGVSQVDVIVDKVKRGKRTTSDAEVEIIAAVKGKRFAFKEIGSNIYQAFYRVYGKVEKKLRRSLREKKKKR